MKSPIIRILYKPCCLTMSIAISKNARIVANFTPGLAYIPNIIRSFLSKETPLKQPHSSLFRNYHGADSLPRPYISVHSQQVPCVRILAILAYRKSASTSHQINDEHPLSTHAFTTHFPPMTNPFSTHFLFQDLLPQSHATGTP